MTGVARFIICGLTDARIPWPIGKRGRYKSLVVYKDLARAIRREAAQAVAYSWGLTAQTITKWRKALGVGPTTEGTSELRRAYALEPPITEARRRAWAKSRDPVRRAKIAAAKRGKPRPRHVVEAVIAAHHGMVHSPESRRKMSEAHRRRGTRPPKAGRPWTPEEDALLRMLPAKEVVKQTARTLRAVYDRRRDLGLPDGRKRRTQSPSSPTGITAKN